MLKRAPLIPVLFIAAITFSHQSIASNFSYDYVEIVRLQSETDVDGFDLEGDGNAIVISKGVASNVAVFFSYQDEDFDFDIEAEAMTLGVDLYKSISDSSDIVLSVAAVQVEVSQPLVGSDDDTGNIVALELRNRLAKSVELDLFVARTDTFDDAVTSYGFELQLGSSEGIQLTLGYGKSDDSEVIGGGIRFNY